jgi:hypothetical protein
MNPLVQAILVPPITISSVQSWAGSVRVIQFRFCRAFECALFLFSGNWRLLTSDIFLSWISYPVCIDKPSKVSVPGPSSPNTAHTN